MSAPLPRNWEAAPCLDLINSHWSDHLGSGKHFDRLPAPLWRRALLKRWNYRVDDPDDDVAIARLGRLRTLLRRALETYMSGRQLRASLLAELEAEINTAPAKLRIKSGPGGYELVWQRSGTSWARVTAEIALSAARLISENRPIKVCSNPHCSWMFIDESRPGTRRWCDVSVCGSLINVRRHRAIDIP